MKELRPCLECGFDNVFESETCSVCGEELVAWAVFPEHEEEVSFLKALKGITLTRGILASMAGAAALLVIFIALLSHWRVERAASLEKERAMEKELLARGACPYGVVLLNGNDSERAFTLNFRDLPEKDFLGTLEACAGTFESPIMSEEEPVDALYVVIRDEGGAILRSEIGREDAEKIIKGELNPLESLRKTVMEEEGEEGSEPEGAEKESVIPIPPELRGIDVLNPPTIEDIPSINKLLPADAPGTAAEKGGGEVPVSDSADAVPEEDKERRLIRPPEGAGEEESPEKSGISSPPTFSEKDEAVAKQKKRRRDIHRPNRLRKREKPE